MADDGEGLRERLQHVYWLGGGSGAGKSTIARRLAEPHGLRLYATDDVMPDHASRCSPEDGPFLAAFKAMDMDERWVNRSPETMLETFHWFRGEGFNLIVEDLLEFPPEQGVIVEGFRLLPHLVKPLLKSPSQAVWLIPTPEFRLSAFEGRGSLWSIAERTRHPERALANLLKRDHMFSARIEGELKEDGTTLIEVDGAISEDELTNRVASHFGL
jgi:cytidylate kinase